MIRTFNIYMPVKTIYQITSTFSEGSIRLCNYPLLCHKVLVKEISRYEFC